MVREGNTSERVINIMSIKRRWSCEGSFLRRLPNFFLTLHQPDVTPASLPAFVLSSFQWVHYAHLRMLAWVHTTLILKFPLISFSLLCENTLLPHVTFTSHIEIFCMGLASVLFGPTNYYSIRISSAYYTGLSFFSLNTIKPQSV